MRILPESPPAVQGWSPQRIPLIPLLLLPLALGGQAAQRPPPDSRAALEQQERDKKTAEVKPWEPDKVEQIYDRVIKNPVVKGFLTPESGWTVQFGGLYPGSGFALGPKFVRRGLAREHVDLAFSAAGSISKYYGFTAGASLPHIAQDRIYLDFVAKRMDAPGSTITVPATPLRKTAGPGFATRT